MDLYLAQFAIKAIIGGYLGDFTRNAISVQLKHFFILLLLLFAGDVGELKLLTALRYRSLTDMIPIMVADTMNSVSGGNCPLMACTPFSRLAEIFYK